LAGGVGPSSTSGTGAGIGRPMTDRPRAKTPLSPARVQYARLRTGAEKGCAAGQLELGAKGGPKKQQRRPPATRRSKEEAETKKGRWPRRRERGRERTSHKGAGEKKGESAGWPRPLSVPAAPAKETQTKAMLKKGRARPYLTCRQRPGTYGQTRGQSKSPPIQNGVG